MNSFKKMAGLNLKVIYTYPDDTLAFEPGKVYEVMSIEHGYYRVMTELDEDYLFPPECFEIVFDGRNAEKQS